MNDIIKKLKNKFGELPKSFELAINSNFIENKEAEVFSYKWLPSSDIGVVNIDGFREGLLVFASNDDVNYWCIDTENECQIILCYHDATEALLYAPNFESWVYRICLEELLDYSDEDDLVISQVKNCNAFLSQINEVKFRFINDLMLKEPFVHDDGYGVIELNEVNEIISEEFGLNFIESYISIISD